MAPAWAAVAAISGWRGDVISARHRAHHRHCTAGQRRKEPCRRDSACPGRTPHAPLSLRLGPHTPVRIVSHYHTRLCQQTLTLCDHISTLAALLQMRVTLDSITVDAAAGVASATLSSGAPGAPPFDLRIATYETGVARVRMTENNGMPPRWEVRRAP
jgi:hypothetical protein